MAAPTTPQRASTSIPLLYRIMITTVEPFLALSGALMVLTQPGSYLSSMTRSALTTSPSSLDFIFTELAGGWLHFSFTEAVILRLVDDLRVWKLICAGLLLSDLAYAHSCAQAVGGWGVWCRVWEWEASDWLVTVTTWPFLLARVGVLMGVGVGKGRVE